MVCEGSGGEELLSRRPGCSSTCNHKGEAIFPMGPARLGTKVLQTRSPGTTMLTSFSDWGFKDGATHLHTGDPVLGHSPL